MRTHSLFFAVLQSIKVYSLGLVITCGISLPSLAWSQEAGKERRLSYVEKSTKRICQLTGEEDRQLKQPTLNRTLSRFGLLGTDLGSSFEHKGKLFFLFGDTWERPGDRDSIAWTESRDPEKIDLTFLTGPDGKWLSLEVPGITQAGWDIPSYGVSIDGKMYVVFTTDHSDSKTMGRSVLAVSEDDGKTFRQVYDLSDSKFINVAMWKTDSWLYIFGSGNYRESSVCLARVEQKNVEKRDSLRFFSGQSADGVPQWSEKEGDAALLFHHDVVGELSVAYCEPVKRYVMLYNSLKPRGIVMRSAAQPWGPWSEMEFIFNPERDNGFGHFMHRYDKDHPNADQLSDPNRDRDDAEEYGPYIISRFTKGDENGCRIYYTMSTWNPYEVHIMRSDLQLLPKEEK
jgi:hypothetical protein